MNHLNRVTLIGRAEGDVDVRYSGSGVCVASLRIVTRRKYFDGPEERISKTTHFVKALGKFGELVREWSEAHLPLYDVMVEGRLCNSQYEVDGEVRWKTEVIVSAFEGHFIGRDYQGSVNTLEDTHE